jgi:hypothetical protein
MLVLCLDLVTILLVKPLVASCVFDPEEAMLDHDKEDVLDDATVVSYLKR